MVDLPGFYVGLGGLKLESVQIDDVIILRVNSVDGCNLNTK